MRVGRVRGRLAAAVLVAAAATAACGGSGESNPAARGAVTAPTFGPADVDFVVHLSQHHGQALHLTELAGSRARSDSVKRIAADIASVYAPQLDMLADWIRAWVAAGAQLPAHDIGHGETGPGMVPEGAVNRLEALDGPAFDRQFRALMARHHRGGLQLVAEQLRDGVNPDARALAERLRVAQTTQLEELD